MLSAFGDGIVPVALTFAVLDIGTPTDLGYVFAAFMGARVLSVVAGGVWADRLPRQVVMIAADVVRGVVQAVIALAFFTDAIEVWQLAVGSALFGIAAAFFQPASTALVPEVVGAPRLQEANALLSLCNSTIELFGPAIGGVLVASVGYGLIFAIDAASFVLSAICLLAMRLPRRVERSESRAFLAEAVHGAREALSRGWLRAGMVADAIGNLALAMLFVLGPVIVAQSLDGARDWGFLMTAGAAGAIVGGLVALRYKPRRPLLAAYRMFYVLPLVIVAFVPPLPLIALMVGVACLFGVIALGNAFWMTVEQQHIPRDVLGRVDSFAWMASLVVMPIGYLVAGPLSTAIGTETTLFVAAGLSAASTTGALLVREFRELERLPDEPASDASVAGGLHGPVQPDPLP